MAKFNYKFETVKRIKEKLKSKAQKELSEVNLKIEQKKKKMEETKTEMLENKHLLLQGNCKMVELHYYERHGIFLKGQLDKLTGELGRLEKEKTKKLKTLVDKSKEAKIFEMLEAKHLEKFNEEQMKLENTFLDELAIQKAGRK